MLWRNFKDEYIKSLERRVNELQQSNFVMAHKLGLIDPTACSSTIPGIEAINKLPARSYEDTRNIFLDLLNA